MTGRRERAALCRLHPPPPLRSPADAFPVNRSATGGLSVKHGVCKGGSCIRRRKATRQRDHTSPVTVTGDRRRGCRWARGRRSAPGRPLLRFHRDEAGGWGGESLRRQVSRWKNRTLPAFPRSGGQTCCRSALKPYPRAFSAGI